VTGDKHCDFGWDTATRHVPHRSSAQIMKEQLGHARFLGDRSPVAPKSPNRLPVAASETRSSGVLPATHARVNSYRPTGITASRGSPFLLVSSRRVRSARLTCPTRIDSNSEILQPNWYPASSSARNHRPRFAQATTSAPYWPSSTKPRRTLCSWNLGGEPLGLTILPSVNMRCNAAISRLIVAFDAPACLRSLRYCSRCPR
jgi:hypothetical protein